MRPIRSSAVLRRVCFILTASLLATSCARYSQIPPIQYDDLGKRPRGGYRVTTTDAHVYIVMRMTVQEDALVIHELSDKSTGGTETRTVPFRIARDSVASIERIDGDDEGLTVVVGVIAAVIFGLYKTASFNMPE